MTHPSAPHRWRRLPPALLATLALAVAGCGDDGGPGPPVLETVDVTLTVANLPALDPDSEGTYEGWAIDADGAIRSMGRFTTSGSGGQSVSLESPVKNPMDVMITVEPPGDDDAQPSMLKVMGGAVQGGRAVLDVNRYLTPGIELEPEPGTHVLFTPSDNLELGYPSNEDAGIWLFNIDPETGVADTLNPAFYLTFTPLTAGWTYEGWAVRDHGTDDEVWLSYGKFQPDNRRKARNRDDTGVGPFSGQIDYVEALPREIYFPGDDWVSNPHGYPIPGDLELPIDLNGSPQTGEQSRWTHVVTIEPWEDRDEDPWAAEPFFLRPYRNPIGEGTAEVERVVEYFPDEMPRGEALIGS